jgi:hypothetical protein
MTISISNVKILWNVNKWMNVYPVAVGQLGIQLLSNWLASNWHRVNGRKFFNTNIWIHKGKVDPNFLYFCYLSYDKLVQFGKIFFWIFVLYLLTGSHFINFTYGLLKKTGFNVQMWSRRNRFMTTNQSRERREYNSLFEFTNRIICCFPVGECYNINLSERSSFQ